MTPDPQADDAAVPGSGADRSGDDPSRPPVEAGEEVTSRRTHGPRTEHGSRVGHLVKEVLVVGVTALVISFLIKTFLVQAFWIPSGSMENTLVYGDRVLVSKLQLGPGQIERGDIAVFHDPGGWLPPSEPTDRGPVLNGVIDLLEFVGLAPAGDGDHLIKRVIGVGGDQVACCDDQGRMTVNGQPLAEPYLFPGDEPSLEQFDVTVPEDHYWVMGDHRSNSRDSRANDDGTGVGGSVPEENMVGQALALVWPLDRFDWFTRPDSLAELPDAEAVP